jgi:hypothetical protein
MASACHARADEDIARHKIEKERKMAKRKPAVKELRNGKNGIGGAR